MYVLFIFSIGLGCGALVLYLTVHLPYRAEVAREAAAQRDIDRIRGAYLVAESADLSQPAPTVFYAPIYPGNTRWRDDPNPAWLAWLAEVNPSFNYFRDRDQRVPAPPRLHDIDVTHPDMRGGGLVRPVAYVEPPTRQEVDSLPWSSTDWVAAIAVWPMAVWSDRPAYPLWQKVLDWVWEHTWPYERPICDSAMRVNRWLTNALCRVVEIWIGWARSARGVGVVTIHAIRNR